jgi:hypothetical protein
LEKEKPPVFGIIQFSEEIVIQMLANVRQKTIEWKQVVWFTTA